MKSFCRNAKSIIVFLFISCPLWIFSQNIQFTLQSSGPNEAVIRVDFPSYSATDVLVNGQTMQQLFMADAYPMLQAGAPELLQTSTSLIIPAGSTLSAEVIASESTLLQNVELAPSKGRLLRHVNPASIPYHKGAEYAIDHFICNDTVALGEPYQLRDYHGVAVHFFPFAYNPVQKALKVYSSITVKVRFESNQSVKRIDKVANVFDAVYEQHFLNYQTHKSTPLVENGRILILSPDNFCAALQPYQEWKTKNGYPTEIVPLSTAGSTASAIKNFISAYYDAHSDFAFLVLVGDNGQFPVLVVAGNDSDNNFAEIAGNDVYPDVIVGKISAENIEQVNTQVERFIQYEQNPPETAHFPVYAGIASGEGPGDNNEYDYQHIRGICTKLANYTYTSGYEFFSGNQGGLDANGEPTASAVATAVNAGTGIMVYCGHGSETSWVTSGFSTTNVSNLNNPNKLPFIISVACVNGAYNGRTCFAEAWLRATKNGHPTGAVGALMSTINQPWNSPMCAQDQMVEILTGTSEVSQKFTFGGITFNGIIKMLDEYNDYEVARTWILFGDPALMVRTAVPQPLPIEYTPQLVVGTPTISFASSVENAKVTLTCHNEILATGHISNGALTLDLPISLIPTDTLYVVASAPNYIPVTETIQIIPADGPYLIYNTFSINDNGNHNGQADYGETLNIDLTIENVGSEVSSSAQISLTTEDPYLSIIRGNATCSAIGSHNHNTLTGAFSVRVASDAPDAHNAELKLHITHDGETRVFTKIITLHAPVLTIGAYSINDQSATAPNNRLDFGEMAYMMIDLHNLGHSAAREGTLYVSCPDGKLELFRLPYSTDALAPDGATQVPIRVKVNPDINEATYAQVHVVYSAGDYSISKELTVRIGIQIEDWESGDFSQFSWTNNSSKPWTITTQNPHEGFYAARSGAIGNSSSSVLSYTTTVSAADSISFYYKVSSEQNYDFLKFYIDNVEKDSWSGEKSWNRAVYAVAPGQHTFKWEYVKDFTTTGGSDMAMIDDIIFPCSARPTAVEDVIVTDIEIAPNPTTGAVLISFPTETDLNEIYGMLYDMSGRLLQQISFHSSHTVVDMTGYAADLYLLKIIKNGAPVRTEKIIKK